MLPAIIHLMFLAANGGTWTCTFAPTPEQCQVETQKRLEHLFRPFNVQFVRGAAPSAVHLTVFVTDDNPESWGFYGGILGIAPLRCEGSRTGTAVVFACTDNAWKCAATIAHEIGHLVGLEHIAKGMDLMWPSPGPLAFKDEWLPTVRGECRERQNSFQHLIRRFGPRP